MSITVTVLFLVLPWCWGHAAHGHDIPLPESSPRWVCLSPSGNLVAVAGNDWVAVVDLRQGKEIVRLVGQKKCLFGLAFTMDERGLIGSDRDGYVYRWRLSDGDLVWSGRLAHYPHTLVANADGSMWAALVGKDETRAALVVSEGAPEPSLLERDPDESGVVGVVYDNRSGAFVFGTHAGTIFGIRPKGEPFRMMSVAGKQIDAVGSSGNGRYMWACSRDSRRVVVYDLWKQQMSGCIAVNQKWRPAMCSIDDSGSRICVLYGGVYAESFNIATGLFLGHCGELREDAEPFYLFDSSVVSADGATVVLLRAGVFVCYDTASGRPLYGSVCKEGSWRVMGRGPAGFVVMTRDSKRKESTLSVILPSAGLPAGYHWWHWPNLLVMGVLFCVVALLVVRHLRARRVCAGPGDCEAGKVK